MFKQRLLTAIILGPVALLCVFLLSPFWFSLVLGAVVVIGALEWGNLSGLGLSARRFYSILVAALIATFFGLGISSVSPYILSVAGLFWLWAVFLIFRYPQNTGFSRSDARLLIGLLVLLPSWMALSEIKSMGHGNLLLMLLLLLVWGADIGAYCAGKLFGRHKLIPQVSPGKTWEGLVGGVVSCLLIAAVYALLRELPMATLAYLLFLALLTCVAAVFGDLFESMLKRERGIKDSGKLLPGHGGILDRIDSLTAAAPVFMLGLYFAPAL